MVKSLLLLFVLFFFLCGCNSKTTIEEDKKQTIDSVSIYIEKSKIATLKMKHVLLDKALLYNSNEDNDSLRNLNLHKLAFRYLKLPDSTLFKKTNSEAYVLSLNLKDTLGIADTHWNLGLFYGDKEVYDSSYYHYFQAYKYYELIDSAYLSAKMLYNMAFIQSRLRDYTSAESELFEAISKYKRLDKNTSLYQCHKLLAAIYMNLEDYDNSILYYNKAQEYLLKAKDKELHSDLVLNDIAVTYQKMGQYKKSVSYFKEVLTKDSLYHKNINVYAKVTENLAYSRLLMGDTLNVKKNLLKALKIRDSLNNYSGIAINKIYLAHYYIAAKDTTNAIKVAKASNTIATDLKNNSSRLNSLLLLSKIEKDSMSFHFNNYVLLKETLEKQERAFKNKFARIRFETDEYIDKAEKLVFQKAILTICIVSSIFVFSLLFFLKTQHSKNKQLQLETEQQKANEAIYQLMLKQQSNLEEGRLKERYRISEELHDGILGKIFGTRMGFGFINFKGDKKELQQYQEYIGDLQKIEKEIRDISHELKNEILSTNNNYITLIEDLVKEKSVIGAFKYSINNDQSSFWNDSNDTIKINIYRVTQEILQNIIKHAKATDIVLDFSYKDGNLIVTLKDNGIGFDDGIKRKGIGLSNIKSRVKNLSGQVHFNTAPNKGTTVKIEIPYKS